MTKLNPCPECGNLEPYVMEYDYCRYSTYAVECDGLDCEFDSDMESYDTRQEAIDAWNKKTLNAQNAEPALKTKS